MKERTTRIEAVTRLPADFDAIAGEVAAGLAGLYGPDAGPSYRRRARQTMTAQLTHPSCLILGAYRGEALAGMLAGVLREDLGEISFLHVRRGFHDSGIEAALVAEAVAAYRAGGVAGVVFECIPFCPLKVHETFVGLGFEQVRRELMCMGAWDLIERAGDTDAATALTVSDWPEAAACIVDAYRDHPGRRLHYEVRDIVHTAEFVTRVAEGRYGRVIEGGLLGVRGETGLLGVVACCEVAPEVGFVLQLAVRRACQGRGLGRALLGAAAAKFAEAGMTRIALGVTVADPAHAIYERLGFKRLRPVDAYVWWRPDQAPGACP